MMREPEIDLAWLVALVLNDLPPQPDLEPLKARLRVLEQQRATAEETLKELEMGREGISIGISQFLLGSDRVLRLLLLEIGIAVRLRDGLRGLE